MLSGSEAVSEEHTTKLCEWLGVFLFGQYDLWTSLLQLLWLFGENSWCHISSMQKQPYHSKLEKAVERYKREPQRHIPVSTSQCLMVAGLTGLLEKLMETGWEKLIRLKIILCTLAFSLYLQVWDSHWPPIVNEPGKNFVDIHAMGTEANSGFPWHSVIDYDAVE